MRKKDSGDCSTSEEAEVQEGIQILNWFHDKRHGWDNGHVVMKSVEQTIALYQCCSHDFDDYSVLMQENSCF